MISYILCQTTTGVGPGKKSHVGIPLAYSGEWDKYIMFRKSVTFMFGGSGMDLRELHRDVHRGS